MTQQSFLLGAVKDSDFHSTVLRKFSLRPGPVLHVARRACQLRHESILHVMELLYCLSSLFHLSVKACSYHFHLNWITTVSVFYNTTSKGLLMWNTVIGTCWDTQNFSSVASLSIFQKVVPGPQTSFKLSDSFKKGHSMNRGILGDEERKMCLKKRKKKIVLHFCSLQLPKSMCLQM